MRGRSSARGPLRRFSHFISRIKTKNELADQAQPVLPQLNAPAPNFKAKTTHGERKLRNYQGHWLVLFSHPADFTPVCTTEFIAFSKAWPEFRKFLFGMGAKH